MTVNLKNRKHAFTLVEILVVVSILVILTGLLVPRLRVISNERQIREAARNVSSLFSRASQAAIIDGVSGVVLERNPNVSRQWPNLTVSGDPALGGGPLNLAPFNFRHGGHRLSLLRSVPDFRGDRTASVAYLADMSPLVLTELGGRYSQRPVAELTTRLGAGAIIVEIETPIEHSKVNTFTDGNSTEEELLLAAEQERRKIIRPGDAIVFNNSNVEYRISSVLLSDQGTYLDPVLGSIPTNTGERMLLQMALSAYLPPPAGPVQAFGASMTDAMPYRVIRRPRRLKSSEIELPEGFQIDLRFSGVGDQVFSPASFDKPNGNPDSIEILFDERGAVDRVDSDGATDIGVQIASPIFFFVTRLSGTEDEFSDNPPPTNPLANDENLWVIVNPVTGTVSVGYNGSAEPFQDPANNGEIFTAKNFPNVDDLLDGHSLVPGADTRFSAALNACRTFANTSTANQ